MLVFFAAGTIAPPTPPTGGGAGVEDILNAEVEPGMTLRQSLRLLGAILGGRVTGMGIAGGTVKFRNPANTKDRLVAVIDGKGNRSAVTYDMS